MSSERQGEPASISTAPGPTTVVIADAAPAPEPAHRDSAFSVEVIERAKAVAAVQRELTNATVFVWREKPPELAVSPEARGALRKLKDAILGALDVELPAAVERPSPADELRSAFVAGGVVWSGGPGSEWKEAALDISIKVPAGHHDRWLVEACILLAPGSDCIAAVYQRRNGRVQSVLIARSDDYANSRGARHATSWDISPPDPGDSYYLVGVYTYPWPSSCWRDFEYVALAPTAEPSHPSQLASGTGVAYWCSGLRINAQPDRFTVAYKVSNEHGTDTTEHVDEWTRQNGQFRLTKKDRPPDDSKK